MKINTQNAEAYFRLVSCIQRGLIMDSEDESRPGSSASNSSDSSDGNNSDNNSRPSSPEPPKRPNSGSGSPQSGVERAVSRVSSRSSRAGRSVSSKSGSSSTSSSSSSSSDEEDATSPKDNNKSPSKAISRSSSEESMGNRQGAVSRNQSISPVRRKSHSSRNSSASSGDGSLEENREDGTINMSHEDLSDVSETDCEKRQEKTIKEHSKLLIEDEVTNGSVTNINDIDNELENGGDNDNENDDEIVHEQNHHDDDDDVHRMQQKDEGKLNGDRKEEPIITDLRQKLDLKKAEQLKAAEKTEDEIDAQGKKNGTVATDIDELVKKHDEDALDFEAEEGECPEISKEEQDKLDREAKKDNLQHSEPEEGEELEEGEVSDEDEKRPEETEPKPVCRFYTRGQCTWGMSCRFLHPGVTDKGNYTMFDMVRPVPVPPAGARPMSGGFGHDNYHDFRTDRPPIHHRAPPMHHHSAIPFTAHHDPRAIPPVAAPDTPVVVESAWERGLRTAKEMMRKANKRKEQDMDFEDKKMNLTLSPDELEKDNYYIKDRASPPEGAPQYPRHQNYQEPQGIYTPPERFGRAAPPIYDDVDPYGRSARYRELPPHRMPHYEDERRVRPAREVIVQRVEPTGRGDEWNDPWMRSKSPGGGRPVSDRERSDKRRRDRRSYSSNSSYSSSSSSQSDSSSESSRTPSPDNRRRYNSGIHKTSPPRRHFRATGLRSPSPRRPRRSPSIHRSPVTKRRGHSSPSPLPEKRVVYSPSSRKRRISPSLKKSVTEKGKKKRRGSSSSGSDSSGSGSDSSSSSSESSSQSRGKTPVKRIRTIEKITNERKAIKKVELVKKRSPISIEIKKPATVGASALTSPSNSNSSEKPEVKDVKKSRREELLKQLRAVEDAIAKKRSKLT